MGFKAHLIQKNIEKKNNIDINIAVFSLMFLNVVVAKSIFGEEIVSGEFFFSNNKKNFGKFTMFAIN